MSTQSLRLAVAQSHTLATTPETLAALEATTKIASSQGADLILFPEAYIGGYPRTATFGSAIGARHPEGKEQFLTYFKDAVDLGDTPQGAGDKWIRRELEQPREGRRGDGTREELERIAKTTGVFLVVGLIERCAGTLYCGVVYVCPRYGIIGKRRKVMPTGSERLIWGQGQASSLRAVTTTIRGVKLTLASAICWENYMPLLRQSLYSQNVNLYLAPTADGRDTWLPLMRTIACEGRCVVLSANQCMAENKLPSWITGNDTRSEAPDRRAERSETRSGSIGGRSTRSSSEYLRTRKADVIEEDRELSPAARPETEDFSNKSQRRSSEFTKPLPNVRRNSTVTEDGHQIVLPGVQENGAGNIQSESDAVKELKKPEAGVEPETDKSQVPASFSRSHRRPSMVTIDGHEIILPEIRESYGLKEATTESNPDPPKLISRGGSCVVSPTGDVIAGPLWDDENGLLIADVDFDDCLRGRLDLDVGGSYSRNDAFKLTVEGLDLSPPP